MGMVVVVSKGGNEILVETIFSCLTVTPALRPWIFLSSKKMHCNGA